MRNQLNKNSANSVLGVRKSHDINSTIVSTSSTELTDGNGTDLGESAEELNKNLSQKQTPVGSLSKHEQLVGDLRYIFMIIEKLKK